MSISWEDFERVDVRVGVVVDAQEFPEARRPAFKLCPVGPRAAAPEGGVWRVLDFGGHGAGALRLRFVL